jgi:hypothetical protein
MIQNSDANWTYQASVPSIPTPDQPQPVKGSARIQASGTANISILEKVVQVVKERDLEGNFSISSHNSFSVLHDEVILSKALEIGIDASSLPLETVHMLKDLELARYNLAKKSTQIPSSVVIMQYSECDNNNKCEDTKSGENSSHDESGSGDDDDFTPIMSRKKRMEIREKKSSGKKSNQGVPLGGTKSLKKVSTNHPLCDIVSGPRLRSKNVKDK